MLFRSREIFSRIQGWYKKGVFSVILVSHNMDDIARLATRLLVMHQGRLVLDGEPMDIFLHHRETLRECGVDAPPLTQSSILLTGRDVNADYVRQIINLTQTTSASYLLLSSLDISRRNLALRGEESFAKVAQMSEYARQEINSIGGYYAYGRDLVNGTSIYDYDVTKLSIYTLDIGLAGIEVYDLLRDEYDIQIEFGDICNILAYISIGDRIQDIERLVGALEDIKRLYSKDKTGLLSGEYINPKVAVSPQEAFYSQKKSVRIMDAVGAVSGEFVMCYPPGIPILAPGELITKEIAQYIVYAKEKGCSMQGTEDPAVEYLKVLKQ